MHPACPMKPFKYFLATLVALVGLGLMLANFLPRNFETESTIVINRQSAVVYEYVRKIKNQRHYAVWHQNDPDFTHEFKGQDGTVGFVYRWNSKIYTDGEMTITVVDEGRRMEMNAYLADLDANVHAEFLVFPVNEQQTRVIWRFSGELQFPKNILLLGYDFQPIFDQSIAQLKANLEALP